ncbi:hypothetical protein [Pseudogulbenkiania sp. MAI-1]|uniref:hypothetical protein n=1 Tax=Pseudogulbenkiania sp. MAI-1 TaxID=990370 RepID=UPI0012EC0B4D|nr:hypothetical protein [Pseudogulbenkiania sp. MAI-1]
MNRAKLSPYGANHPLSNRFDFDPNRFEFGGAIILGSNRFEYGEIVGRPKNVRFCVSFLPTIVHLQQILKAAKLNFLQ